MKNHKIANASVFATMMVVGIHTAGRWLGDDALGSALWFWETWGYFGVFLIAVPFFFVCSGFFLAAHMEETGWWYRECLKRVRTLVVPYIIWSLAYAFLPLTMEFAANIMHGKIAIPQTDFGLRFLIDTMGLSPFRLPRHYSLWYLRTLIIFVVLSPIFLFLIRKFGKWYLATLFFASLAVGAYRVYAPSSRFGLFFTECFQLQGLFFFCCGIYGRMNNIRLPNKGHCIALLVGVGVIAVSVLGRVRFGENFLPAARILFVPLFLFGLWRFVPERPFPKLITGATFAVYVIHALVFLTIRCACPFQIETISQWFGKWAIGFFGSVAITHIMRLRWPKAASLLFGGR
ncbi:MAG: acyltransferase [Kiritimatiellae bacterium]|nr:acyltransferase [Kiritimatiellia bacterium]